MSMDDLRQALDLISEREDEADFVGPRGELIDAAEQTLGHPLPPTYRTFLSELGAGDIAGLEVYGIVDDDFENSSVPDAIWLTIDERGDDGLPEGLVPIMQDYDGSFAAIDMRRAGPDGEAPVVAWFPGQDDVEPLADDFGAFLLERLRDALG
jgi:hypothetical protein